jgi:hypothetical protein
MNVKSKLWLGAIFLFVLALRLLVAFQSEGLDYEAYSVLRQVQSIHDTGVPIFNDELSYSGRVHIFSPIYHYFLASFAFFLPIEMVAKVVPNILSSLIVLIVFFFALYFTKDEIPSLIVAALAGIIPVFFDKTVNSASIYSAVIPLFFLTAYFFVLTYKDNKHVWALLFSMILLTFLHPSSLILVLCLLVYIFLINLENFRKSFRETELVLFFMFFVFWANITIYKRALLTHGDLILFQNIPSDIVSGSFKSITFLESIYAVGVIPLIFGLIAIYFALFVSNSKALMFITSITLSVFVLLLFKLIQFDIGLIFLSISLIILASFSIGKTYEYMRMVKLKYAHSYFLVVILIASIALFSSGIFASQHNVIEKEDFNAMIWLENNTQKEDIILALPEEGSAISFITGSKNVMDDNYLMIKNIDVRYEDVTSIYEDRFITTALEKLNYYSVDYIFLSQYNQKKNNITSLEFFDESCVEIIYPEKYSEEYIDRYLDEISREAISDNERNISSIRGDFIVKNIKNDPSPKIYRVECQLKINAREV